MSCRIAWSDRHGEHQCRHPEAHETRRLGCVCGSYANDRGSVVHSTPRTTSCAERTPAGDRDREVLDPPEHLPARH